MSAAATGQIAKARRRPSRTWSRLISAEILKLRKRRGLLWSSIALVIGPQLVAYTVLAALHAADPAKYDPAGGVDNLTGGIQVLLTLGLVAAIMIGATAGAGDLHAGVFRELVVTGRSRIQLFLARVPGGLALLLPLAAISFAGSAIACALLAGNLESPSPSLLVKAGLWVLLGFTLQFALALGVASLVGSRSITIGVVLAWQLVIAPILVGFSKLGMAREFFPNAAFERLAPGPFAGHGSPDIPMSVVAAVAVLAGWLLVPLAVGAWRTATRDA
jgi:ABC-type transport system involved in multi-copper enzyme maturation permease subunit